MSMEGILLPGVWGQVVLGAAALFATILMLGPFTRYLTVTWLARYSEFRNRLQDGAVALYLQHFWRQRYDRRGDQAAGPLFETIFYQTFGRRFFIVPLIFLTVATFVEAGLTIGYLGNSLEKGFGSNNGVAVAAIAGAYLFVVSNAILLVRQRALSSFDAYNFALRMVVAAPMGMALSEVASPAVGGLVAFGLGAFPLEELNKILRRLTSAKLNSGEQRPETGDDDLVKMVGVTVRISSTLMAEGVDSAQMLAKIDPVLLSIRSGFSFEFILDLVSQAIAWSYVGAKVIGLAPLSLNTAYEMNKFIADFDAARARAAAPGATAADRTELAALLVRLRDAATLLAIAPESAEGDFRAVARDRYTQFVVAIYDGPNAGEA